MDIISGDIILNPGPIQNNHLTENWKKKIETGA